MSERKEKHLSPPPSVVAAPIDSASALVREVFTFDRIPGSVRTSPLRLRDWLDLHIPTLVGPSIDSFDPPGGQRGTIVTIRGERFATRRADNQVTIGGTTVPVLAASDTELKVLVTPDVDTGPIKVMVGTHASAGPHPFTIGGYPGEGEDGPPVFATGTGDGAAGDVNPIGTINVLVVVCQATDRVPANLATVRTGLNTRWTNVQTFYNQASYARTNVQFDIVNTAAQLDGVFTDFVDLGGSVQNVIGAQRDRIAAIAARHAQNAGFDLNHYQMISYVVFTNGAFIRAWGGIDTSHFVYDDGKPTSDPTHIHIDIPVTHAINELWINESADWGRFAHEFGHNVVSAPTETGEGTATLGEDVYGSDLVDSSAATAQSFEMMGDHDHHPIFTGYHLQKLGYYNAPNVREIQWDRNPHSEDVDIIAHGLTEDTTAGRVHILRIKISNALSYFVEVRQRPGTTTQLFDDNIPIGVAANQGGVIVTRVIADEMHNNQQTRFITLMHDNRVQIQGDVIEDPARALRISVLNDAVQARPLVCRVRVEWAQTIADDPHGSFDINVEPWDSSWQSPDIWIDRTPIGTFDFGVDGSGRPNGNGDRPWVAHANQFTTRVHVSGAMGASNVKVTFYAVTPPGVGDNGNWAPIAVRNISAIAASSFVDTFCTWVPTVGNHTCLKVFASPQLGEISGGNNGAQENVFNFQAAGSSPADPLFIKTAVRNPVDEPRAIQLRLRGVPLGWAAQIPHAWVWLDGKGEKEIDVMIWPLSDVDVYKLPSNKDGRYVATAPVKVGGFLERSYAELMPDFKQPPGSRFFPIGGTFYRVGVRKQATIRIEVQDKEQRATAIDVHGSVGPARGGQKVLVDVLLPDGKTHRSIQTTTKTTGEFAASLSLVDRHRKVMPGPYRVQAFINNADELADAESNVVYVKR